MQRSDISIVIPAMNEAPQIAACIESAKQAGAREVIVSDGGSSDDTVSIATNAGASHVIASLPGRGIQQNAGSTFATGDVVLFLHADNRIDERVLSQIVELGEDLVWGAIRQRIDDPSRVYRWLEFGNAMRVRWRKMAFGDQAMFVRRDVFKKAGGFAEEPLMEDVELSKSLRKIAKPKLIDGPVVVSARRWQERGVVRQTLLNWKIQAAYKLGVAPQTLADWYER